MDKKAGDIVYAMGNYWRIKEVTGPESYSLDLLPIKEVYAIEAQASNEIARLKREELEAKEISFRIVYKNGDLSRKFQSISKIRKYAKRHQNIHHLAKFIGKDEQYIIEQ